MKRRRRVLVAACLLALLAGGTSNPSPNSLIPPLEQLSGLVASFGEYRPDHLHPGIDLSTGGKDGLPVHAVEDGEVYRLKVEWRGYGRALYLRHPDGRISVYAHLERFEDSSLGLEKRVAEARLKTGARYPGDLFLEPPVPVLRGAVVGYSGESGAGMPHLHFEMRRSDQEPADPLAGGWFAGPKLRPIFESIRLVADDPRTFIAGKRIFEVPLSQGTDGVFVPSGTIGLTGPFLPQARIHAEDGIGHRLGIKGLTVSWDGRIIYQFRLESFTFSDYPVVGLLLDHSESRTSPPSFCYWLVRLPGNRLGRTEPPEQPWPALSPGRHLLEVEAVGALDERATARVPIEVVSPSPLRWEEAPEAGSGRVGVRFETEPGDPAGAERLEYETLPEGRQLPCAKRESLPDGETCSFDIPAGSLGITASLFHGSVLRGRATRFLMGPTAVLSPPEIQVLPFRHFVDVRLRVPRGARSVPTAIWLGKGDRSEAIELVQDGQGFLRGTIPAEIWSGSDRVELDGTGNSEAPRMATPVQPQIGDPDRPLLVEGGAGRLEIAAGALYDRTPVRGEPLDPTPPSPPALAPIGTPVRFLPAGLPLARKGKLEMNLPPGEGHPEKVGIYRFDPGRGSWDYLGGERKGDRLVVPVGRLDSFGLLRDDSPPRIVGLEPSGNLSRRALGARLRIRVEDRGSGLNFDGVHLLLDGKELETEFDPDRDWAVADVPKGLSPGTHKIKTWAVDRAGNRSPVTDFRLSIH